MKDQFVQIFEGPDIADVQRQINEFNVEGYTRGTIGLDVGERAAAAVVYNPVFELKEATIGNTLLPSNDISEILFDLGFSPHLKGFRYAKMGIALLLENLSLAEQMTKSFYPAIAEKFDTDWSKVERCIRHSVEKAWADGEGPLTKLYPWNHCPTLSEFFAVLFEKIKMQQAG